MPVSLSRHPGGPRPGLHLEATQTPDDAFEDLLDSGRDARKAALRRCIVSGERHPPGVLIRFVLAEASRVVPDLDQRLPGRGAWVLCRRQLVTEARTRRHFARAFRQQVEVDQDLEDQLADGLRRQLLDRIGLARRAGALTLGRGKLEAAARERKRPALILHAGDGSPDSRDELDRLLACPALVLPVSANDLAAAAGAASPAVHLGIDPGPFVDQLARASGRLSAFEPAAEQGERERRDG